MTSNMFDEDQVKSFIDVIEALEGEVATSKANHMNFARKKGDEIKEVFDEAKEAGVPKKVLAKMLKRRSLEGKIKKLDDELDEDHKPLYQSLAEVFAAYQPMTQTSMFEEDEDEDDGKDGGFDPDFVDPAAEQQQREQEEGETVLSGES